MKRLLPPIDYRIGEEKYTRGEWVLDIFIICITIVNVGLLLILGLVVGGVL